MIESRYLGDGVYVSVAEATGVLALTVGSHKREEADSIIFLDANVVTALNKYLSDYKKLTEV